MRSSLAPLAPMTTRLPCRGSVRFDLIGPRIEGVFPTRFRFEGDCIMMKKEMGDTHGEQGSPGRRTP